MEVVDRKGTVLSSALGTYRIFPGKAEAFKKRLRKHPLSADASSEK